MTAFPEIQAGRLPHHPFRGLLSVYSRYGLHTRQVPCRTLYTEGFSRFVTSMLGAVSTPWISGGLKTVIVAAVWHGIPRFSQVPASSFRDVVFGPVAFAFDDAGVGMME